MYIQFIQPFAKMLEEMKQKSIARYQAGMDNIKPLELSLNLTYQDCKTWVTHEQSESKEEHDQLQSKKEVIKRSHNDKLFF